MRWRAIKDMGRWMGSRGSSLEGLIFGEQVTISSRFASYVSMPNIIKEILRRR